MSQEVDLGTYRATVITELAEAVQLADVWESCQRSFGVTHVEQHLDWFGLRTDEEQSAGTPLIVVLYRGAEVVGIAPFTVRSTYWHCKVGYRSIVKFPVRQAHVYGDAFLLPADADAYQAVLMALARCVARCHIVFLECLSTDSVLWQVVSGSPELPMEYWRYTPDGPVPHLKIAVAGSFDEYFKGLTKKDRWNIRHPLKRFDDAFRERWSVRRVTDREQVAQYVADVEEISRASWQGRQLGRHIRQTAARETYLEECADRGWLRCYILECDGRPIAFLEGLQPGAVYLPDETGYLPDWNEHQPGKVLFYKAVQDTYEWKPPRTFDFGYGDNVYKRQFANQSTAQVNVYLFRKSLYTGAALATHSILGRLMRTSRQLLDRLDMRERARRLLRQR